MGAGSGAGSGQREPGEEERHPKGANWRETDCFRGLIAAAREGRALKYEREGLGLVFGRSPLLGGLCSAA